MASVKEIQTRISSIKDTMKITNAMYMISSSKVQKAKKKLASAEPFFFEQQEAVARFIQAVPNAEESSYFGHQNKKEEDKVHGVVVITADKGLAGAYNHNVLKLAEEGMANHKNTRLFVIGEIGRQYFLNKGYDVDHAFHYTVQKPTLYRAREIAAMLIDLYMREELDEIHIVYTRMENSFSMTADHFCLLPLEKKLFVNTDLKREYSRVTTFHPSIEVVLRNLIPNVVSGYIYGALVESFASEHNSRMMAMQSATDSAKELLHDLNIEYNRVRQAAITQELTEVISGAKAQKNKKK